MKYLSYFIIVIVTTLLQISIVEQFINKSFFINLPLIVLIFFNWANPSKESFSLTLMLGIAISYFDGFIFGVSLTLFALIGLFIQFFSEHFLTNRTLWSLLIAGVMGLGVYYSLYTLLSLTNLGLPLTQITVYFLSFSIMLSHGVIALILLCFYKLFIFRHEIAKS